MEALSPARLGRARHRHELRTLTYVTLDQANGGVVRNLSHDGIAVQAVTVVRPRQQVQVRFDLRYPRLRVETRGEVMWANFSGQCGIRFLDLPPRLARQIDEWIFATLLEGVGLHSEQAGDMFVESTSSPSAPAATLPVADAAAGSAMEDDDDDDDDGLIVSATPLRVIEMPVRPEPVKLPDRRRDSMDPIPQMPVELDWLSQPLSGRGLAWTVNALVMVAALLLFALVFLSVTRELPKWPLAMAAGAAISVASLYWVFFKAFGGASLGARLARLAGSDREDDEDAGGDRFR